ncbi:MAG: peptidoglycan DD-metalloendopeptidase family protein [Gammaproteobacteria bacterium]
MSLTKSNWRCYCIWPLMLLLTACGGKTLAPVGTPRGYEPAAARTTQQAPVGRATMTADGHHVVSRGDTLYSIAWRYGHDYRDVARWNNIRAPFLIRPGDRILVRAPAQRTTATRQPSPSATTGKTSPPITTRRKPEQKPSPPVSAGDPESRQTTPPATTSKSSAAAVTGPVQWQWPTAGELLKVRTPTGEKGIRIGGRINQPVSASAPGRVVYSGSGLIGYGRLIIIKHNDTYLSAYAHNNELLVKEGDNVTAGQKIATMGAGVDGRALLHFEIRRDGQPVDPLKHLPQRQG